jgi:hypothetical protein
MVLSEQVRPKGTSENSYCTDQFLKNKFSIYFQKNPQKLKWTFHISNPVPRGVSKSLHYNFEKI